MLGIKLFKKHRHSKKLKIFAVLFAVATILIMTISFFMDDDMYTYYMQKDEGTRGKSIYDMIDSTGRKIYYTANKEKLKSGSKKGSGSSVDASEDEILKAIQEIVGNFDDAWIKGDTPMLENQIAYIKKALPMMIKMHMRYPDIFTSTGMIQNTQESGWNGEPSVPGSNNFFGIKDGGRAQTEYWHGEVVNRWAVEGGMANFCQYPDVMTSVMDYGAFLKTNSRYDKAGVFQASSSVEQITRIMNAGYAPGSESMYIKHAEDLMGRLQFGRFDDLAEKVKDALSKADSNNTDASDSDSDEWEPNGGGLQKVSDAGVDTSSINSKRKKVLAEAESLMGTPYREVRPWLLPTKNDDGSYNVTTGYLDCSALTNVAYANTLGVDIGGNTWAQLASSNLETINISDAKPGDLYFPHSGHVTLFLKNNGNGTNLVLHEPHSGEVCKIANYNQASGGVYMRLKGIDD